MTLLTHSHSNPTLITLHVYDITTSHQKQIMSNIEQQTSSNLVKHRTHFGRMHIHYRIIRWNSKAGWLMVSSFCGAGSACRHLCSSFKVGQSPTKSASLCESTAVLWCDLQNRMCSLPLGKWLLCIQIWTQTGSGLLFLNSIINALRPWELIRFRPSRRIRQIWTLRLKKKNKS